MEDLSNDHGDHPIQCDNNQKLCNEKDLSSKETKQKSRF